MATKLEKKQDQERASAILWNFAPEIENDNALFLITQEYGKGITDYLRVQIAYTDKAGSIQTAHLTWALAQLFGYSLRDRQGYHYLAISGGGYSKADEIARSLAFFFGTNRVRYELN